MRTKKNNFKNGGMNMKSNYFAVVGLAEQLVDLQDKNDDLVLYPFDDLAMMDEFETMIERMQKKGLKVCVPLSTPDDIETFSIIWSEIPKIFLAINPKPNEPLDVDAEPYYDLLMQSVKWFSEDDRFYVGGTPSLDVLDNGTMPFRKAVVQQYIKEFLVCYKTETLSGRTFTCIHKDGVISALDAGKIVIATKSRTNAFHTEHISFNSFQKGSDDILSEFDWVLRLTLNSVPIPDEIAQEEYHRLGSSPAASIDGDAERLVYDEEDEMCPGNQSAVFNRFDCFYEVDPNDIDMVEMGEDLHRYVVTECALWHIAMCDWARIE